MSVVYNPPTKSARMQAVIAAIDAVGTGTIEIGTVQMAVVLASFALQHPSFTEANGIITLVGAPLKSTAVAGGTAAAARIKNGSGTIIISGLTVGLSGSDINLNAVALNTTEEVTIASGAISHA